MRIEVDRAICKNHGQCAISAPSNFWLSAAGELQYREDFADSVADDVEDAADVCPVQAIALVSGVVHDER